MMLSVMIKVLRVSISLVWMCNEDPESALWLGPDNRIEFKLRTKTSFLISLKELQEQSSRFPSAGDDSLH